MAEALYRKYRPQVFSDVVGQDHIERTIKNALDANQVSHAYLFCGPRGTGKTTTARLLAKALLCEKGPTSEPDGTCPECLQIAEGVHPDVYELDAASRTGVENVRDEIIGRVNYAPTRGKSKVYIIDEVHMLSVAAFNALLKTLEEPPEHVVFILCTTDPQKVPETIHSRCQRFDFHRLSNDEIVSRLGAVCVAEGVEFEGDALDLIAHRAEGGMRNALTSLEQLIAFGEGSVTVQGAEDLLGSLGTTDMAEIVRAVGQRDVAACFNWVAGYVESGADLAQFARDMADHVRNMYVLSLAGTDTALEIPEAERRQLAEELGLFGPDRCARLLGVLGDLISDLRTATNPRLCFEIALTRMVRPDADLTLEALAERVEALESGALPAGARGAAPAAASVAAGAQPAGAQPAGSVAPAQKGSVAPAPSSAADAGLHDQGAVHRRPEDAQRPAGEAQQPASAAQLANQAVPATPEAQAVAAPATPALAPAAAAPAASTDNVAATSAAPAPAPAVAPAPAAPAAAGSADLAGLLGNPAALQRVWQQVVSTVKKEKVSYGVLLVNVKARPSADGQAVEIEFPPDNPFAFSMVQKPDVQALMAQAFEQAAGCVVPFAAVIADSTQDMAFAPAAEAASAPEVAPTSAPAQQPAPGAATPAPAPAPATAPVPETASAPQPAAAFVPEPPAEDQVPLDAYDVTPGTVVEEPAPAISADVPFDPDPPAVSAVPFDPDPAPAQAASAPLAPSAQPPTLDTQAASEDLDSGDLGKMLSDVMGTPIVVEEVDE